MRSIAVLGAVGGAGTTRTCLEFGSILARDGRSVAILDAAYATQGLSDHVRGRITCDMTALVLNDSPLESGLVDFDLSDRSGRLACCPAHAPFERLARAKTPEAAQRFEERIEEAVRSFDHVLVDTPPVAANQAIAAVTSVERVALVAPADQRGSDGISRLCDRLTDIGISTFWTIRTNATEETLDADGILPTPDVTDPNSVPTTIRGGGQFTTAVADAVETVLDTDLGVELQTGGLFS
ncbi:AAA family ATPase [Halocatena marina]|uniref:AAA family ATPase n=1 Tax=Halocatena marina TaxID=2934937 RepID=UPI00200E3EB6|nr:AAA family ATPase [Halocatena marina]